MPLPTIKPFVPVTVTSTVADPPTVTGKVTPLVEARVKVWFVAVTVRLGLGDALCAAPPVPLAVPLTVIVCAPEGSAMFAVVLMVRVTFWEALPLSVTLCGLKLHSAPGGRPAGQLPGAELVEFVKLIVCVELFTGAMVKVTADDCPAGMDAGDAALAVRVKSGFVTVIIVAAEVAELSDASPS
jgi:hypothetical protein